MIITTVEMTADKGELTGTSAEAATRLSTRQLLEKTPNVTGLYRHSVNQAYYGIKKHGGKRKEHSLDTTDRKIAARKLKEWTASLDKVDAEAEKTTLAGLLEKFTKGRAGMSDSTKATEQGIIKKLKANWGYGLEIRVTKIRPAVVLFDLEQNAIICRVTAVLRAGALDVTLKDWQTAGLLKPSVARLDRVVTAEKSLFVCRLGVLIVKDQKAIRDRWNEHMRL